MTPLFDTPEDRPTRCCSRNDFPTPTGVPEARCFRAALPAVAQVPRQLEALLLGQEGVPVAQQRLGRSGELRREEQREPPPTGECRAPGEVLDDCGGFGAWGFLSRKGVSISLERPRAYEHVSCVKGRA